MTIVGAIVRYWYGFLADTYFQRAAEDRVSSDVDATILWVDHLILSRRVSLTLCVLKTLTFY